MGMKRFLMIILSFIFLGGAVTGSALLFSGCDSVQTESGGGISQDDILNDEKDVVANADGETTINLHFSSISSGYVTATYFDLDGESQKLYMQYGQSFNVKTGTEVEIYTSNKYTVIGGETKYFGGYFWGYFEDEDPLYYTTKPDSIDLTYTFVAEGDSMDLSILLGEDTGRVYLYSYYVNTGYSNTPLSPLSDYSGYATVNVSYMTDSGRVESEDTLTESREWLGSSLAYCGTYEITITPSDDYIFLGWYDYINTYNTNEFIDFYDELITTGHTIRGCFNNSGYSYEILSPVFIRKSASLENFITFDIEFNCVDQINVELNIEGAGISSVINNESNELILYLDSQSEVWSVNLQVVAPKNDYLISFNNISSTNNLSTELTVTRGNTYSIEVSQSFTITYNGNGATGGSTASTTVNAGSSVALRSNGFTRTGYSFSGWATSASGNKVYSNGQTITPTGNMTLYAVWVDNINPTISRVTYAQNGGTSYYAYAYASDSGSGLNRVQFPTWTANYDQDDIVWYTGTKGSWTVGGQTYNYRYLVQASNHSGEYGTYITHVYAYDNAGNSIGNGSMTNIRMTSSVSVNPNGGTYNGSSATSSTTQNSGKTLGLNFARAGYNLSNVTSTAGTLSKSQVTGTMTFSGSNYVNLGRTYMYSNKLTWAVTAYMDNWSQYQSGNMRLISCTESGGFNLEPNGSTVRFAVYDKARAGYNSITTSVTWASLSGWVQFAMVFDGHYARGYINGELVGTSKYEYTNGIGYHASNAIFIGAEASSNATKPAGNYFKGKIRSVHIINEAVNQEDLANLDNQYALYVKGNTTVTASWSVATYTVTYNANGGTLRNYNYATRTSNYSSSDGGVSVNYNATTGIATLNGTLTANIEITRFYDTFTAGTYTVGWEVIGGSMTRNAGCFAFEFVRDDGSGLTNRTNTDIVSTATSVSASMTLSSSMAPEADMLKLWIWYNGNASYVFNNLQLRVFAYLNTPAISSQKITHGTNAKMAYATRTGFYFSGWNTRANGTGTTYGPGNIGSITANTTLYAQWTARNEAKYDSAGKYWYVENGKIPQTKVTNSTLISNLNKATTNGANYYIAGQTLTAKVYSGKEYCKWNNNWYEVEPIKWRLDYSSSQTNGYGTTSATSAVLAEIVYVGQYSSSNIGSGAGYSSTAVTQFLRNGIDTTFLSTYTASTQTFGNGTSLYGSANVSSNMFVASSSEINSVSETLAVGFSDLVKDIIKANGGTSVYFTRDLGSNYNNIVCFNEVGRESQRMATAIRGVQFTVRFTEYACVA